LKREGEVSLTTASGGKVLGRNPAIRRGEEEEDDFDDDFNDNLKISMVP
jgi:hypothetical protein